MTTYDDATIWKVAEALHSSSHSTPFNGLDSSEHMEYFGMAEAALDAVPQADTNIRRQGAAVHGVTVSSCVSRGMGSTMPEYTDDQIETAARAARTAWHRGRDYPWDLVDSDTQEDWRGAALAAFASLEPAPDPELVTWDPSQGPFAEALADLPDGYEVTINGNDFRLDATVEHLDGRHGFEHFLYSTVNPGALPITSAQWRRPLPAWARPNLPLVIALDTDILVLGDDGRYRRNLSRNVIPRTAVKMEQLAASIAAQVRVLIDADGRHVKEQP